LKELTRQRASACFTAMTLITAPADNPTTFVDDYLLYHLASASQHLSDEFHRKVKASGTKIHVWRVLACVVDQPGLMLTSLSKLVLYEQSRLTKIIDQMVGDGLVNRQAVAGDRRKMAIFVTAKGQDLVAPLLISAKTHETKVLENLTDSEKTVLKRVLKKLCNPPT
jgi:DNA-binding MarR family transcriptional regulator